MALHSPIHWFHRLRLLLISQHSMLNYSAVVESEPCAAPACLNQCPNGFLKTKDGCSTCDCGEKLPLELLVQQSPERYRIINRVVFRFSSSGLSWHTVSENSQLPPTVSGRTRRVVSSANAVSFYLYTFIYMLSRGTHYDSYILAITLSLSLSPIEKPRCRSRRCLKTLSCPNGFRTNKKGCPVCRCSEFLSTVIKTSAIVIWICLLLFS